ncbi:MAG: rod-binding protein [Alphaproteobacteria bacterium]
MEKINNNMVAPAANIKTASQPINPKIMKSAREFEQMFLAQMLQPMFAEQASDNMFGGGHAEETVKSLLTDAYARQMNNKGGIGLTPHIYNEMVKMQEERSKNHGR